MTKTLSDLAATQIQEARQRRGWSAKRLAARCAAVGAGTLTAAVLANIETGRRDRDGRRRREITIDELAGIALALGVSPVDLLNPSDASTTVHVTTYVATSPAGAASWLKGEGAQLAPSLLGGLALCGSCETPLLARAEADNIVYFCANAFCPAPVIDTRADYVDSFVAELIIRWVQHCCMEALFPQEPGIDAQISELESEIGKLRQHRAKAQHELENLADHAGLSPKTIARSLASFNEKIKILEDNLKDARRRLLLEMYHEYIWAGWDADRLAEKRQLIGAVMNVTINPAPVQHADESSEVESFVRRIEVQWVRT